MFVIDSRLSTTNLTLGCAFRAAMNNGPSTSARSHSWSAPKLYKVAWVALARISTMDGSTLRNELREFVAACDAAFWLAKFVVAAGGDWPRFPFCWRGIVAASF